MSSGQMPTASEILDVLDRLERDPERRRLLASGYEIFRVCVAEALLNEDSTDWLAQRMQQLLGEGLIAHGPISGGVREPAVWDGNWLQSVHDWRVTVGPRGAGRLCIRWGCAGALCCGMVGSVCSRGCCEDHFDAGLPCQLRDLFPARPSRGEFFGASLDRVADASAARLGNLRPPRRAATGQDLASRSRESPYCRAISASATDSGEGVRHEPADARRPLRLRGRRSQTLRAAPGGYRVACGARSRRWARAPWRSPPRGGLTRERCRRCLSRDARSDYLPAQAGGVAAGAENNRRGSSGAGPAASGLGGVVPSVNLTMELGGAFTDTGRS